MHAVDHTLIIPTKNRPHFVQRLLTYYLSLGFSGTVVIIDSSDARVAEDIKEFVESINKVNYIYLYSKGLPLQVIKDNLDCIKTKYVSSCGDDDFIIPDAILRSITFLDNHQDISACRGDGFVISDTNIPGESIGMYTQIKRLEDTASDRLANHFANYGSSIFHVFRSDLFKKAISATPPISKMEEGYDRLIGDELLVSGLMLVYGKFAPIEGLHVVRTASQEGKKLRRSWETKHLRKGREMAIKDFIKKVSIAISDEDSIDIHEAEKRSITALRLFFGLNVNEEQEYEGLGELVLVETIKPSQVTVYSGSKTVRTKQSIRSFFMFLGLLEIFDAIKNKIFINNKRLGLKNVLDPNNFYHKDFIPVYSSLVTFHSQKSDSSKQLRDITSIK